MRNSIILLISLAFITCNKDDKSTISKINSNNYDFSKDSCGLNLLKGTYVSNSNINDTLVIDNNISAYVNGAKPSSTSYVDIFSYCATKDSITINRWGWTKFNTPQINISYSLSNSSLSFSKIIIPNINCNCDTFFASISNKIFTKIK